MGPQTRRPEGISLPEKHCFLKISNYRSNLVRSVRDNEKNRQKLRLCNKVSSQSQDVVSLSTHSQTLHPLIPPAPAMVRLSLYTTVHTWSASLVNYFFPQFRHRCMVSWYPAVLLGKIHGNLHLVYPLLTALSTLSLSFPVCKLGYGQHLRVNQAMQKM